LLIPYFPACKTHRPIRRSLIFSLQIKKKKNDECILILVIYWKKTGLLRMEISNHNIIYSSWKPRKSSLPLKSSSQLFSLDASLIDVRVFISLEINTYPWRVRLCSNSGHFFWGGSASYRPGNTVFTLEGGFTIVYFHLDIESQLSNSSEQLLCYEFQTRHLTHSLPKSTIIDLTLCPTQPPMRWRARQVS
jgi:hypothetical protein